MKDNDDFPEPRFSFDQTEEMRSIGSDEEAFENLAACFELVHGRPPARATEAFEWGAKNTVANLKGMGFKGREGFQCNYDLVLMVEQGPRAGDTVN